MAARRNHRGQQRGRGRFGFLYKLMSVVAILAALIIGCVVFFRVGTIQVEGNGRYAAEEIISAAEVQEGNNLFALNKFGMQRQILSRLPYVNTVAISRRLPDTLVIRITECTPLACIQGDGAWWILGTGGKILERTDAAGAAAYPVVKGVTPVAPAVGSKITLSSEESFKQEGLRGLLDALELYGVYDQVSAFDFSALNYILVGYAGRYTIKMPMSTKFDRAVRKAVEAVEFLPETDTGILDLTVNEKEVHLIPYS